MEISKLKMLVGMGAFALFAVPMATAQDNAALMECRKIDNDIARLICYDKLADTVSGSATKAVVAKPTVPAARSQQPSTLAQRSKDARDSSEKPSATPNAVFGDEDLPREKRITGQDKAQEIRVTVVKLGETARGRALFYLDDGQVWEQTDRLRPRRYRVPYEAKILRASLGSYMIQKDNSKVRMRVKRKK